MLNEHNIRSGDDYADLLTRDMKLFMTDVPVDVIEYWSREIRTLCNIRYLEYVEGKVESFMLNDEEMIETYNIATQKLVGDTLGDLVEKGMVKMSVNDEGEVLYSSTEKGLEYAKNQ